MHTEFGATGFDDEISQTASERTSLASWGKKLLMEHSADSPIAVRPTDSLSTRGPIANIPAPLYSPMSPNNVPYKTDEEPELEKLDEIEKTEGTKKSVEKRQTSPNENSTPSSPPPIHPPPPLPETWTREDVSIQNLRPGPSLSPPIPPPLPPRKVTGGQTPQLPKSIVEQPQSIKSRYKFNSFLFIKA